MMDRPSKNHPLVFTALLLIWVTAIACIFTQAPASKSSPATPAAGQPNPTTPFSAATQPSGEIAPTRIATPQDEISQPDPLDHLLAMRSIQFNLQVTRPDGSNRSLDAEIDSVGNMHLKFGYQGFDLKGMPKDYDPKALPPFVELYVVDGKAYLPDAQDPTWSTTPFDDNYPADLSLELHGMESPAMWLNILPPGSLQPAGNESVGGFAADKYSVNGSVDGQQITGTLWEEPQADALVQAELHVPAALLSPPKQPQASEMLITLKAQKADVPLVVLPSAQPGATTTASGSNTPSVSNVYNLIHYNSFLSKLTTSPGKVWIGSLQGTVDVWDSQSGAQLQSISLFQDSGGNTPRPVYDLQYDGQNVWALAGSTEDMQADHLFVIDPENGKILQQYDTSQWLNNDDARLGLSPGLIWTESHVIDTKTFEATHVAHPDSPSYAYDGQGWMWIVGTFCEACGYNIWLFNADTPSEDKYGPRAVGSSTTMTAVGDRMWIATSETGGYVLQVYDANGGKINGDTQPLLKVPAADDRPLRLLYDGHALWLLAGGKNSGALFQLDPQTGVVVNKLDIPASEKGDDPEDMAFDGHDLWVITVKQLVRISLPWG
jgi:hypothetical protein